MTDIEFLRRRHNITQQQLADLAGCSRSMIEALESGYEPKRSRVFPRVLAALVALNVVDSGQAEPRT